MPALVHLLDRVTIGCFQTILKHCAERESRAALLAAKKKSPLRVKFSGRKSTARLSPIRLKAAC
jgi:hypothetical protein